MSDFESFIKAIKQENVNEVKRLFREEYISQKSGKWTPLQVASNNNKNGEIAKFLLNEGCNPEDQIYNGRKCIHLASLNGRAEVLKTLIEAGCDLDSVTKDKETALDLAIKKGNDICVKILKKAKVSPSVNEDIDFLEKNSLSMILDLQTGETLLDKLIKKNEPKILDAIRLKPVNAEEIKEWIDLKSQGVDSKSLILLQECMLSRSILQKYYEGIEDLCNPDMANKESLFMGPSTIETAIECGLMNYYVKDIISKLEKEDESWTRAENMARKKNNKKIINMISKRRNYLKTQKKKGFGRLHVASIENDPDMIQYMLDHLSISSDEDHGKVGSALSLSYNLGHTECANILRMNKVDINVVDKLGQSALHMAIYNRVEDACEYLVDNTRDIESRDFMNFTVLERSVMNDCKEICETIVRRGAKCDEYVQFDQRLLDIDKDLRMILLNIPHLPLAYSETIYTLCFKVNKVVYPGLLDTIEQRTVDLTDGCGNSLLHLCAVSLKKDICSKLIWKSANVNLENKTKRTPLFELLTQNYNESEKEIKEDILETVNVLIGGGASTCAKDINECTIFEIATKYKNEKLLLALIRNTESLKSLEKLQWLTWLDNKYYTLIKEVIPLVEESLIATWITKESIKICLDDKEVILAKAMSQIQESFFKDNQSNERLSTISNVSSSNCQMAVEEIGSLNSQITYTDSISLTSYADLHQEEGVTDPPIINNDDGSYLFSSFFSVPDDD